ncbi:hypothetical protein ASPACDRAFT_1891999 [Aspergillus aculeatus ATCC 16872]|uniref:Uncharacterized protein n=1 Tax=Aspergillus aculeatus (strain ATCC 16872 / CBS 172.66 / WB 5094) TaxID=690307 RepID=A0A1L9WG30_ASPA1|nr:uncharacterized protein ASPACDRAFT_1891999 [Aspergillus aculeatus ATCC 16872]OJJ95093.1 hypothetical protein ASPACDRAFT_1891999 [Aspergillus aculeatus ATCC 16872]
MLQNSELAPPTFTPFPLTPLDHLLPRLHMTCFPYLATKSPAEDVLILKDGLEFLVTQNPILAGDVCPSSRPEGKANRFELRPPTEFSLKEYPLFQTRVHAQEYFYRQKTAHSHRVTGSDLGQAKYRPVPLDAVNQERAPGLRWQLNVFEDGIVIGICFHHLFVDAVGVYIILQALSACCRGLKHPRQIALQPVDTVCRKRIIAMGEQTKTTPGIRRVDIFPNVNTALDVAVGRIPCQLVTVPFEVMSRLREACQTITTDLLSPLSTDGDQSVSQVPPIFSDSDVAAALMWLCWARSRYHQLESASRPDETSIILMIELRHRGVLPLNYIGDAVAPVAASAPLSPAVKSPTKAAATDPQHTSPEMYRQVPGLSTYDLALLADLTFRAFKASVGVDEEYIRGLVREKHSSSDWQSYYPSEGQFLYSNMRLLNTTGLNFGKKLGNIVRLDTLDNRTNGQCWVLPAPNRMAPWEFRVSMEREDMERFLEDPLLVWAMGRNVARL